MLWDIGQKIISLNIGKQMTEKEDDKIEFLKVEQLLNKIEQIDGKYVNKESDLISKKQPFLISLLLGYRFDVKKLELEELMKIIFLIWEYFKTSPQIGKTKISKSQFERIQKRNVHMLKYFQGEQGQSAQLELIASNLEHLKSKVLFSEVIIQFNKKDALLNMNGETKGIILVGLKSLIE